MKTVCMCNMCTGCMACVDICPVKAINIQDNLKNYNAQIDETRCINCQKCSRVCPESNIHKSCMPQIWYQGWAKDTLIRSGSSSGGIATEIIRAFLTSGGIVASCIYRNGSFGFELVSDVASYDCFRGSKYVKSNPVGIYRKIKESLEKKNKVLFIGLPCQVSAVKNFCPNNELLYTIDLICHGTPSPQFLDLFLNQYGRDLKSIKEIAFRNKTHYQIYEYIDHEFCGIEKNGITDSYSIAFLNGLFNTDNCYNCHYAQIERVSDLTLGDSWGSDLSEDQINAGISLVLIQTEKGKYLLDGCEIQLMPVDIEKAIKNNKQLMAPPKEPEIRNDFFESIFRGIRIDKLIMKYYPKTYIKQRIKKLFYSLR